MAKSKLPTIAQFRPYLTTHEIRLLQTLLASAKENPLVALLPEYKTLNKKFKHLGFKISENLIAPSSTVVKRMSVEDSLGFSNSESSRAQFLYENYIGASATHSIQELTAEELQLVEEYRYNNDLMTPEEMTKFENKLLNQ